MCRWLAYSGEPIFMDTLVVRPSHSLIDQSMYARQNYLPHSPMAHAKHPGAVTTNGDGFGLGWYGEREVPGVYRDVRPAWNDANLHRIAEQVRSGLFLAHIRAAMGGTVTRTNCHPFQHDRWLWQYNGEIDEFEHVVRDLRFEIAPELYPSIKGNNDTETCFFLALTYGLAEDPVRAIERTIARVERAQRDRGVDGVFRCTGATTDGEVIYAWRYATDDTAKTLYYNAGPEALRTCAGDRIPIPEKAVIVVSEPLELHYGPHWIEVPPSTVVTIRRGGEVETVPLRVSGRG
ncbi:class II glutamine amidotransferase [Longimycelium tulufanense]|uniref:Class II glutamine amidotransferase n=2 Tax=Longimycelium tulufanense TaxID=907463 RepID=A0A8J3CC05_9PSEU|nr:class II glutamine amidotransferase [Longimycelium tulufanense]